jgi:hypothetical protein
MTRSDILSVLHRAALTACDRGDRRWLDAGVAELSQITGRRERMAWLLGLAGIVVASNAGRVRRLLRLNLALAGGAASASAVAFLALFLHGKEVMGADDDLMGVMSLGAMLAMIVFLRRASTAPETAKG